MTQKKTLEARLVRMSWSEIPKTFQNAIEVARQLGINYLWIDSLCIIQDDIDDWAQESSQMWYIYANSSLTIAASAAENAAQGFLNERTQSYVSMMSKAHNLTFTVRDDLHEMDNLKSDLLATRGWVLQERLLSCRVLYFEDAEMKWECRTLQACECGSEDWSRITQPVSLTTAHTHLYTSIPTIEVYDWWRNVIVEHYSELELTRWTDRLPALSGLAALVRAKTQDTYLAGIWLSDLANGLLWESSQLRAKRADKLLRYPREMHHPSWSWTHSHWPVKYQRLPLTKIYASLQNFDIGLASVDQTSAICRGVLEIACPVFRGVHLTDPYQFSLTGRVVLIDGPSLRVLANMDTMVDTDDFSLALIGERKDRIDSTFNRVTLSGLVLDVATSSENESAPRHRVGHWRSTFTERADSPYDESFVMKKMTRSKLE
jgi:hypothetical protein